MYLFMYMYICYLNLYWYSWHIYWYIWLAYWYVWYPYWYIGMIFYTYGSVPQRSVFRNWRKKIRFPARLETQKGSTRHLTKYWMAISCHTFYKIGRPWNHLGEEAPTETRVRMRLRPCSSMPAGSTTRPCSNLISPSPSCLQQGSPKAFRNSPRILP